MYKVVFTPESEKDLAKLKKSEPVSFKKVTKLIDELVEHPTTGTGKPKPLSGDKAGQWSRRISDKHRLIYMIDDEKVVVLLLSAYGHYDDK
ncbi:MAG: Txe/YoeB family addiction module toxin [Dysgonamonadaceae bacterium]|jgi:toxin YoeB|nr:Txe/YoeB family addiction module toxin [Dysgonamonadaceae bacterium]